MHYVDVVLAAEFGYLSLQEWIEDLGRILKVRHRIKRTHIGDMSKIPLSPHKNNRSEEEGSSVPELADHLVQGQIAINFISEGYLYAVLDNYQQSATPSDPQQSELNQLVAAQSNPGQTVFGVPTPTDPTVQARIQALTASLGPSGLDTAKALRKESSAGFNRHDR